MPASPAALTPTACSLSRSHRPLPPPAPAPTACSPSCSSTLLRCDLVAKCYFAKRKLVWEVLEGGLKSKVEFNWSNFTAIKAVFFEGGHGTLDIVLARPPLFFRATDPQPRKHTLWQATRDFTNGQEYIHRYEGDLVAKCYFAKRKLVWEVLEGGLKSKVEFNWSNFTAIKAIFFEGGHGTLDIVLARPPLFFRATDPQPRKHTLWQATRDFTNGQEYIHRYEGDLVAKCYFAKRKLVWEVLEGGLKSKVEFNWSNFTAIKAIFFEGGHGTLDIVLARPPLFFRATDPQPRKHTLWQATRDFTNGQEYIHRRHLLQCPQTLLSKNFEKLIDCDSHLKLLIEELASGNTSLPCDALFDKEITDYIAQFFDNDSQSSAQAGVGSDDEPYSTLEAEVSFLEFLIVPCCDKS
ncbi:hypothetical protein ZIOFF_022041 [Zingiber officinale]|uniref:TRF2/HOY1 PH-like domain-containing protein n=1 Tax=Zingiber officinale TaxID=94328 RepID=A0A8J5H105_ZINOF|nr:hypothetical protein ZIOFF_022041 [Zingiber officinale]